MTSRRRRKTSSPMPRRCLASKPPPEEPFDQARLSAMAREFYADNKRVSIAKAKTKLGFYPLYPTYREGLKALAEAGEGQA